MSRNALIASLAGALALGLSAFSAQAASVPMSRPVSTAARQASSRRRITATTDTIAIIGTIATTGIIATVTTAQAAAPLMR